MADSDSPESKLIIDEDWKSQAQAEKERLQREQQAKHPEHAAASGAPSAPHEPAPPGQSTEKPAAHADESQAHSAGTQLPPASLHTLVSMLATQAMMLMGQLPNPATNQYEHDFSQAKHFIDTIGVVEEKTRGNVTPGERQLLDSLLHELRMAFVTLQSQAKGAVK